MVKWTATCPGPLPSLILTSIEFFPLPNHDDGLAGSGLVRSFTGEAVLLSFIHIPVRAMAFLVGGSSSLPVQYPGPMAWWSHCHLPPLVLLLPQILLSWLQTPS